MSDHGTVQLPKPGDVIARKYTVERIIGQGGMGAVFAARHTELGRAVAIKVMLADRQNEEATRRFKNEGRASANIQNDHVVRIFDIDEEHGYAYMVLELLEGEDLAQVLETQRRLAPHVAVGYVVQALEGVRQAHELGIVHRDLKPSNLFLARLQGGRIVVKVLDFGISKARGGSALEMAPHQQTSTAAMLGSPLYMSPEQLRSSKNVDARADIWAMGVILYELLTGAVPFEGETLGALFSAILETDAPRVSTKIRDVPPGLDAIVSRCLQRRPEDRFATAADLQRELAPFVRAEGPTAPLAVPPLMMTAAMPPQASITGGQASSGAMSGPMGPPPGGHPGYGAMAQSASGSNPQSQQLVVPGTVPLGSVTPQPYRQTGNTWQSTGSGTRPKASMGKILGAIVVFGTLLSVGVGFIVYVTRHPPKVVITQGSAVISTTVTPPTSAADPLPSAAAAPASAAPTAATSPAVAAATPPATSNATSTTKRPPVTTPATTKVEPKPPEVAKVDPPHPPPTPPAPTHAPPAATPAAGTLQGAR
jgi:serine/threonine protein kinase